MAKWIGEVFREAVIGGVMAGLVDGLKEGGRKVGVITSEKIAKKFEEHRDELFAFLRGLDLKNLLRRWRERQICQQPYKPGDEARFQEALTKLYTHLAEPSEKEIRKQMFRWLDKMPDEEFNVVVEMLRYDNVIQWLKRSWGWLQEAGKNIFSFLYSADPESPGTYQKLDAFLNEKLGPATERIRTLRESRINRRYR